MHSTDDKQAQASAPELDVKSVKDEAVASQCAVNEQVSDAGNDEDQFYSILSKLKEAVDADRDTLEAALGKQGNAAAAATTGETADNEAAEAEASDKDVEANDAQAASSGEAKLSDSGVSSKSAHVSTGPLAAAAHADSESAEHSSEDMEKLKSKLKHLHRYHTAQQKAIREHIEEHFGKIYLQVEDVKDDGLRIDIDIIKAEPEQGVSIPFLLPRVWARIVCVYLKSCCSIAILMRLRQKPRLAMSRMQRLLLATMSVVSCIWNCQHQWILSQKKMRIAGQSLCSMP